MAMPRLALLVLTATTILGQNPGTGERKLATIPANLELRSNKRVHGGHDIEARVGFAFGNGGKFVAYGAFRRDNFVEMVGDGELGEFRALESALR